MAKRVHDIAKELGISSKVIVEKCRAEGISETVVKGHMSTLSVGLEATIREWFTADAESSHSAVETAEKVDLSTVRAAPKKAKAKARKVDEPEGGETSVATIDAPAPAAPAPAAAPEPEPEARSRAKPAAEAPPVLAATVATPEPTVTEPAGAPGGGEAVETKRPAVAARATVVQPSAPSKPITPAPINVPTRPRIVTPAGPRLEERAPVKLSGPKVVRVEAPEVMDQPRRRPGPAQAGPPTGGGMMTPSRPGGRAGQGAGAGATEDDRARQAGGPRGNKRRATGGIPSRRRGVANEWTGPTSSAWREQDLAEREARLARSGGFLRKRRQELRRQGASEAKADAGPASGVVRMASPFTIKDLSAATGVKAADIVKKLFLQGMMATINSGIEPEKAQEIMLEFDIELEVTTARTAEQVVHEEFGSRETVDERPRGPVVTILGHVDHGKTSLLDKIRNANVAAGEAGGITQKTSAFRVSIEVAGDEKKVVFLDTPGHEAFTAMRSRGAHMTDVVVLVVSAPEGVMPQTIESINHAKAAGVPIVVALNKIDRPDATEGAVQKTLGQLAEQGLNPVEWGGDTEVVRTSATTGQGIAELLEALDYQAQLRELRADFGGPARGTVIEAKVEEGRGAVANLLVQDGTLRVGDFIVAGRAFGRIRDIMDDRGQRLKEADPPNPVQIIGIDEVPDAGDRFYVVDSLKKAQEAAEQRRMRDREAQLAQPKLTLDSLFTQIAEGDKKEILIVLKADVQGSVDVLKSEIEKVTTNEVKVRVLHAAIGGINESDVLLADASRAIIVGFNVIPSGKARSLAETKGVEIRTYQVIYDITDDIRKAAEGLLAPEMKQQILGHAEVRQVFKITRVGTIAGCYVTDGTIERNALIRVTRNGVVIENNRVLDQLKRFKDDAKEVRAGMECGMKIVGYDDIKEGDILECYKTVEVKRTL